MFRIFFLSLMLLPFALFAQIKLEANTNSNTIAKGEVLSITYTLDLDEKSSSLTVDNFIEPDFSADFKLLRGPMKRNSLEIINGVRSRSLSYSYSIIALKTGDFTLPSLKVDIDGNTFESNKPSLKVQKVKAGNSSKKKDYKRLQEQQKVKSIQI